MRGKRFWSMIVACAFLISCICMPAMAAEEGGYETVSLITRASGSFHMEVSGNTAVQANTSFPLEAGDTVTIKATYSPFTASVDFGLIAPDGYFYYLNTTDGSFDATIEVDETGNYTFAVRNNSSQTVKVTGFVKY